MLNMGNWHGKQIIPMAAVSDIEKGGSKVAFKKSGHPELEGWSYGDMWRITENADGAFAVRTNDLYRSKCGDDYRTDASHPIVTNAAKDAYSLPAYQAVADYLMNKK